jgi:multidrug transporter EmrE-like cation transporter
MKHAYWMALGAALVMNATANLMMKFGMERYKASGVSLGQGAGAVVAALASNWVLLLGLGLFGANVVLYTFALKGLPISVAYPIMVTLGFAIIVVVAGWRLQERLSPVQWFGVALILGGVWLVGSRATAQLGGEPPPAAARSSTG